MGIGIIHDIRTKQLKCQHCKREFSMKIDWKGVLAVKCPTCGNCTEIREVKS